MTLTTTLFGAAAVASGYWFWRKLRGQQRDAFIAGYGFPDRLRSKLQERYPHLTPSQTGEVLRGLREYFQLCRLADRHMVAMPSQAVDVAWHEFILYTRQYRAFCRKGLGRFLHHVPNDVMPSQRRASEGIRRAWRLACLRESLDPRAPARLPLLFALDAQLGIADGFHYRLDCAANPGSYSSGDAYCASHIGCSSGCSSGCGGSSASDSGGGDGSGCGGGCGGGGGD